MDIKEYQALNLANIAAYESCRDFLSKEHHGEYVLIYGGKIRGIFPSEGEAVRAGDQAEARPCATIMVVPTGQPTVDRSDIRVRLLSQAEPSPVSRAAALREAVLRRPGPNASRRPG
jgi:hypothetical protein